MYTVINASGVSFELPNGRQLFSEVSFSLNTQLTALVGPNGIGKTTLARLIAGELEPTTGHIQRYGAVTYFPQREEPPSISVIEYLGDTYEWSTLIESLLKDIDLGQACTDLSGGQWMRVRLSRIINGQYLILDEPTNDLDREGRALIFSFIQNRHGGSLIISHDRECLHVCDEILELSNRGLKIFGGSWETYLNSKNHERENLEKSLAIAKRERTLAKVDRSEKILNQEKRNHRGKKAAEKGGLPKILIGRRKRQAQFTTARVDVETMENNIKAVGKAHEALKEIKAEPVMFAHIRGEQIPHQKLVAEAAGFNLRFETWVFEKDLTFHWRGPVRVALNGRNGAGKSTLLKALMKTPPNEVRGTLRRGTINTLYIDQRCSLLTETRTVFENVRMHSQLSEPEIRNHLSKFLFTANTVFQTISNLSGGERLRAALAVGFLSNEMPELIILDEPTNNLDLANIEFLENLLREFKGALIVVSHDDAFLRNCGIVSEIEI